MNELEASQKLELLLTERPDATETLRTIDLGVETANGVLRGAVDVRGCLHLLVPVASNEQIRSDLASRGVGIVELQLDNGDGQGRRTLDLHCRLVDRNSVFQALATQVLAAISQERERAAKLPYEYLDRWRHAFERDLTSGLGRKALLGLYGELAVLKWLVSRNAMIELDAWTGPTGQRHDFRGAASSIEVKTTEVGDNRVVEIHGMEQLDPMDDQSLYLAHVRLESHPEGESAADLIEQLSGRFPGDERLQERLKLARYVESPAAREKFEVKELNFFLVDEHFPRLTPSALKSGIAPAGVINVSYHIDLSGVGSPIPVGKLDAIAEEISPGSI